MAIGDLYMATFEQTYGAGGKVCQNVFSFIGDTGAPTAPTLHNAFVTTLLPLINGIQTDTMKNVSLRIINLFSVTDFVDTALTGTGSTFGAGADTLPVHDVQRYTLRINRRDVNPGSKRFSGIAEGAVQNGIVTDAAQLTDIEALRVALGNAITDSGNGFLPVVIKRILMPPDADHPNEWYRLPVNAGEADYGEVIAVSANVRVGTQVSRRQ